MNSNLLDIDIANADYREVLEKQRKLHGDQFVIKIIKAQMPKILEHYIGCTWGACCNMKFNDLIQPYLDNVTLLDQILRSTLIRDRSNVILGKTGARIFDLLLFKLRQCKSEEIRHYLINEFG